jgi:hypothetical protein
MHPPGIPHPRLLDLYNARRKWSTRDASVPPGIALPHPTDPTAPEKSATRTATDPPDHPKVTTGRLHRRDGSKVQVRQRALQKRRLRSQPTTILGTDRGRLSHAVEWSTVTGENGPPRERASPARSSSFGDSLEAPGPRDALQLGDAVVGESDAGARDEATRAPTWTAMPLAVPEPRTRQSERRANLEPARLRAGRTLERREGTSPAHRDLDASPQAAARAAASSMESVSGQRGRAPRGRDRRRSSGRSMPRAAEERRRQESLRGPNVDWAICSTMRCQADSGVRRRCK